MLSLFTTDDPLVLLMLFGAGLFAGAINAVAGGGTFIAFPTMIAAGLPPLVANATNFLALLPGNAMTLMPLRHELVPACRNYPHIIALAIFGGIIGSLALIATGPTNFSALVPWMMLLATSLYALTRPAMRLAQRCFPNPSPNFRKAAPFLLGMATCMVAFYCGYFGAGVGFLFLSLLTLAGINDMVAVQTVKNLTITIITVISIALFGFSGVIAWAEAGLVFSGAVLGGWFGGTMILRVPATLLHYLILLIGAVLTTGFFLFPPS